ncbi:MAG: class I SAM-dependent methyltransferase [Candidatus Micrarchaeota archaeon]
MRLQPAPPICEKPEANLRGWESVASKWEKVRWPRRPRWAGEFQKAGPLLSLAKEKDALVLGATPEFRAWLHKSGARVTLYEKSPLSLSAMSAILEGQLRVRPPRSEIVIPHDWETPVYPREGYSLIMGDIVTGYMETKERFAGFLAKVHDMLKDGGVFLLREFVFEPCLCPPDAIANVDLRRWAYILTPGFAVEGKTFYEEKLAANLRRLGDAAALATCANPPRTRLMLTYKDFSDMFLEAGFREQVLVAPESRDGPKPALWALWK